MDTLILNKDGMPLSVVPLSVVSWQTAIRLLFLDKAKVMKEHEEWTVRSPSTEIHVPSVMITTDYIKWNRHVKYSKVNVFLRDRFTCQYCKKVFDARDLTIDHVLPRSKGGKTNWNNVVSACMVCNTKKGNDSRIRPKKKPHKPSYYELIAMRKHFPVKIRDEYWRNFIDWPDNLIQFVPLNIKRS